jgi:hypothetical protein
VPCNRDGDCLLAQRLNQEDRPDHDQAAVDEEQEAVPIKA